MGSDLFFRTPFVHCSIEIYDIMIADLGKSACLVPLVYIFHTEVLPGLCCRAVDDYFVYFSHSLIISPSNLPVGRLVFPLWGN